MALCLAVMVACVRGADAQQRQYEDGSRTAQVTPTSVGQSEAQKQKAARRKDISKKKPDRSTVDVEEIVVEAKRPLSAASSDEIRTRDYELRPHATTQEILNNVPGLVVAQHQGGGKATQYLVRGFDADHGTDFAVFVDDLPVNLPSHAHGQGYADLNFLIPETVDRLQLYKGPYFAQFGDFATAGALNMVVVRLRIAPPRPPDPADTAWREAQFSDNSCLYNEMATGTPGCSATPGKQGAHPDPPPDIHFTPGNPFNVRGGLTVYFQPGTS